MSANVIDQFQRHLQDQDLSARTVIEYVRDVLKRLPGMKQFEVPSLLPRCWKPIEQTAS